MISARIDPWPVRGRRRRRAAPGDMGLGFSLRSLIQKVSVPVGTAVGTVFGNPAVGAAAGAAAQKLAQKKDDDPAAPTPPAAVTAVGAKPTATPDGYPAPKSSKLPLILAGAGGVAALVAVGLVVYFATRKSTPAYLPLPKRSRARA